MDENGPRVMTDAGGCQGADIDSEVASKCPTCSAYFLVHDPRSTSRTCFGSLDCVIQFKPRTLCKCLARSGRGVDSYVLEDMASRVDHTNGAEYGETRVILIVVETRPNPATNSTKSRARSRCLADAGDRSQIGHPGTRFPDLPASTLVSWVATQVVEWRVNL